MPRLAANLSFLFTELPMLERIGAAAAVGFKGAEILFPYELDMRDVAAAYHEANIEPVLFNTPPGDWEAGDRGFAAVPGSEPLFKSHLAEAMTYAGFVGCRRLHVMAGIPPEGADSIECEALFIENLRMAAAAAAP